MYPTCSNNKHYPEILHKFKHHDVCTTQISVVEGGFFRYIIAHSS